MIDGYGSGAIAPSMDMLCTMDLHDRMDAALAFFDTLVRPRFVCNEWYLHEIGQGLT